MTRQRIAPTASFSVKQCVLATALGLVSLNTTAAYSQECGQPVDFEFEGHVTPVHLEIHGAAPGVLVKWYYSNVGCGETIIPFYNVTLEIEDAVFLAQALTDSNGTAVKNFVVPPIFPLGDVWVQCAELENTSAVVKRVIVQ